MRQIDNMSNSEREGLELKGMLPDRRRRQPEPKTTPGPWFVGLTSGNPGVLEAGSLGVWGDPKYRQPGVVGSGNMICSVAPPGHLTQLDLANAALIAAAPALLEAAEAWERASRDGGISMADLYECAWKKTVEALVLARLEIKFEEEAK